MTTETLARVLVSDRLSDKGLRVLNEAVGIEVDARSGVDPEELRRILPDYDALIIRSGTKVTAEVLEGAERLRVIGRAGIGVDNVDLQAATARGVIVMNTPEGNAITTAEHAIALMTSLARQIPQATASLREGRWEKSKFSGKELFDQVLGVIGLGNIGSIVADRARGLRMRVIAFDPLVSEERAQRLGVDLVSLDELFARADLITIHVPLTKETRGLVGREAFQKMKRGVLIVNAARGGIVDEEALAQAIDRPPQIIRCSTTTGSSRRRTSAPLLRRRRSTSRSTLPSRCATTCSTVWSRTPSTCRRFRPSSSTRSGPSSCSARSWVRSRASAARTAFASSTSSTLVASPNSTCSRSRWRY
jgi:phosphoglycerate dehydrogenase-like enzyme